VAKDTLTFEDWFKLLVTYAKGHSDAKIIDESNPDTYLEYFDDGDSPEDCFDAEFEAQDTSYEW